ncbi:heme abc transporter atp-binding protein [Lasius niger]|uniref:Heme abc transporter atp-binding protein n=1 Tax=Lasius niger TaxID=67767 RepID=A0A0J7L9P0_LASNI|nr:heme abc transporter atp-binding protein [Lasius niger]
MKEGRKEGTKSKTRLRRFRTNASPVFLRILSAVSGRVHHPPGPRSPEGVLSQLGFIKGRSTDTEMSAEGDEREKEEEFKYILYTLRSISCGEAASCLDKN